MDNEISKKVKLYIRLRTGGHGLPEDQLQTGNTFCRDNTWFVTKKAVTGNIIPEPGAPVDLNLYQQVRADKIFAGANAAQAQVTEEISRDLISGLATHGGACLIGYGGTATGKSYTILGNQTANGVLQTTGLALLKKIELQEQGYAGYGLSLSAHLLRKDAVFNLLDDQVASSQISKFDDPQMSAISISGEKELLDTVNKAYQTAKSGASTHMNALPRGHVIFNLILSHPTVFEDQHPTKILQFVDLNGPERLLASTTKTESTLESIAINGHLSSLRLLVENLSKITKTGQKTGDLSHLFTGSKLCRLLSRSLNPSANNTVIVLLTAATADRYHSDSKETANFGLCVTKWQTAAN